MPCLILQPRLLHTQLHGWPRSGKGGKNAKAEAKIVIGTIILFTKKIYKTVSYGAPPLWIHLLKHISRYCSQYGQAEHQNNLRNSSMRLKSFLEDTYILLALSHYHSWGPIRYLRRPQTSVWLWTPSQVWKKGRNKLLNPSVMKITKKMQVSLFSSQQALQKSVHKPLLYGLCTHF